MLPDFIATFLMVSMAQLRKAKTTKNCIWLLWQNQHLGDCDLAREDCCFLTGTYFHVFSQPDSFQHKKMKQNGALSTLLFWQHSFQMSRHACVFSQIRSKLVFCYVSLTMTWANQNHRKDYATVWQFQPWRGPNNPNWNKFAKTTWQSKYDWRDSDKKDWSGDKSRQAWKFENS